ncbi:hypothetical protein SRABI106_02365 [Rahnella aquatilis]|nr:hypothetical protein SRABI106_02365 [Rahnella aquatilis]
MAGRMIGQYQRVLPGIMLEEVIDPFLLKKAANEVKIGFAILNAVFTRLISRTQAQINVADILLAQQLAH